MKTFLVIALVLCLAIAGIVIKINLTKAPAAPPPVATESAASETASTPKVKSGDERAALKTVPVTNQTRHHNVLSAVAPRPDNAPETLAFQHAIDTLLAPQTTFKERQEMWAQLRTAGQLDRAIDTLKQGTNDNPDSPQYATLLGQAYLQKAGEVSRNGGNLNELGILGMSADQSFDNALKNDPANWDAQFLKAVSMSYWPAELNKGQEVVDRLSKLIDQQNTMPAQPEFSLPYVRLGDQYAKLGQADTARQTWQAGAAKFPSDTTLQQKLAAKPQQ